MSLLKCTLCIVQIAPQVLGNFLHAKTKCHYKAAHFLLRLLKGKKKIQSGTQHPDSLIFSLPVEEIAVPLNKAPTNNNNYQNGHDHNTALMPLPRK